jgi:hypothetical protein
MIKIGNVPFNKPKVFFFLLIFVILFSVSLLKVISNQKYIVKTDEAKLERGYDERISLGIYPLVYTDEIISFPEKIKTLSTFSSLWSPNRKVINPSLPTVIDNSLRFDDEGEYYMVVNGKFIIRLLSLNRSETDSEKIQLLHNFTAANFIVTTSEDATFNSNPITYIENFTKSISPGQLLCGPTLNFLELIIQNKLDLPTRHTEFTGVIISEGKIEYSTHNTLEVYERNLNKWINLDPNNAFLVKNSSALDITKSFRKITNGESRRMTNSEFNSMKLDYDTSVQPYDSLEQEVPENTVFNPSSIGPRMVRDNLENLAIIYLGGPTYWADRPIIDPGPYGEFDMYFTAAHSEDLLNEAAVKWESNWDLSVTKIGLEKMDEFLEYAYAPYIKGLK